mmetsp:Transcript_872/g.1826  ORF Transcript_872/g.1826 Transcript_872/m.1826 type:complete len:85 (-) Transcript_872:89-343(-)
MMVDFTVFSIWNGGTSVSNNLSESFTTTERLSKHTTAAHKVNIVHTVPSSLKHRMSHKQKVNKRVTWWDKTAPGTVCTIKENIQ